MVTPQHAAYQIGELAARTGLTPDALRYYKRLGLQPAPQRTSGGFRVYTPVALDWVRFIRQAQTILRSVLEAARYLSTAVDDLARREGESADADPARRERVPDSYQRQRAVVHGAGEAERSGRARPVSALGAQPVADRRAVAAGRSPRADPELVRVLADRPPGRQADNRAVGLGGASRERLRRVRGPRARMSVARATACRGLRSRTASHAATAPGRSARRGLGTSVRVVRSATSGAVWATSNCHGLPRFADG